MIIKLTKLPAQVRLLSLLLISRLLSFLMTGMEVNTSTFRRLSLTCQMLLLVLLIGFSVTSTLKAQVNPPRPINLTTSSVQSLNFGVFAVTGSNGGTVTVSNTGIRTSTGDIFLTGTGYSYGIFTVECIAGTYLHLMSGASAVLTGSNGGQMTMTLHETYPELPYVNNSSTTTVFQIGATLTVGPLQSNPPGEYYGVYEIIINHQ